MTISQVSPNDIADWQQLVLQLWPDAEIDELTMQVAGETAFLVRDDEQIAIGFVNLSLRTDYVPGADQSPVAYVEGLYVAPSHQQQGVGRLLIERAEAWAREQGCAELASDTEVSNTAAETFHKAVGFEEVERIISFIKRV